MLVRDSGEAAVLGAALFISHAGDLSPSVGNKGRAQNPGARLSWT